MSDTMDPRDRETAKWLGQVIDAGDEYSSTTTRALPATSLTQDQATATSAAALAAGSRTTTLQTTTTVVQSTTAQVAAAGANKSGLSSSANAVRPAAVHASGSSNSLTSGQRTAAQRASRLAASGADTALYHPRQPETPKTSRLSSAGAAASLAASGRSTSSPRQSQQRINEIALERSAAGRAAILAARDSTPTEVPEHKLSANAGKAALLAHKDHREYEVPSHQLSANAGKAALLAAHDHVEYQVPEHELSANAGKAALQAAHDHKDYEVPVHQLSANAGTAALLAANHPTAVEVPVHQMSASASSAALLAHQDHKEYEVPAHQLSANAGKAAILAHQDHREYQVPEHALSANAGKAALLAHRESSPAPAKVNPTSAASAANALKAASQAHHDPAMRPTKPEDLQAKGAANALRAASQAHREAPAPFKYVHPSDHPDIGKLARSNTQAYLTEMEPRAPHDHTVAYANQSYNSAKSRQAQADSYRAVSDEAYRSAGLSGAQSSYAGSNAGVGRSRTNTASTAKPPADLMALAQRNVDAQMAERGLTRTASQQTVSTVGAANQGATNAFRDGQGRQAEWDQERESIMGDRETSERINREMAQFDAQRRRNQNNTQVQSALMEAAKRNARLSMAQMEANRPYSAPNLRDTQRMEDLLNEEKVKARRDRPDGAQVDLGGGHYMSQVEIEAVAARRIQPVMDEMDEHVAEINRRKAEIQAQRQAEQARREAERAERQRQKEIERERERKAKAEEKAAKAEAKAKEKAAREALEQKRREEAAAKRAAERQRREEYEAAERRRREEATAATATTVQRTDSAEAVATAQTGAQETSRISTSSRTPLPGTNAPLAGQDLSAETRDGEAAAVGTIATSTDTGAPGLHRSETMDSNEPVATYEVETRGMVTDTEGETDDEWADAMEETPAIERAEFIHLQRLTDQNLAHASRQDTIREEDPASGSAAGHNGTGNVGEDVETSSVATAKPTRAEELLEETTTIRPVTTTSAAPTATTTTGATYTSHHHQTRANDDDEEVETLAPPLSRLNVGSGTSSGIGGGGTGTGTGTSSVGGHEHTRFKEELA